MLFLEAMLYAPPFQFSMNMKPGLNLHRLQDLSSKITKPPVDLTLGSNRGTPGAAKEIDPRIQEDGYLKNGPF